MHAATQFRSTMDQIRKECARGQHGCWIWAKVSGSLEEELIKNRIQDRLQRRLVHDEDFCHNFDAAIANTHTKTFQMNSYQHCICCLDFLYVASAIEISRSQDCLKLSHRIIGVHNAKAEEFTILYIPLEWHGWVTW